MFKWIASKVSSAIPKVVNAVKGAAKAVASAVKKVVSAVPKMLNARKNLEFKFENEINKFLDNLDPDLQEFLFGIERGKLGNEAITFLTRWKVRLLDYGLKKLNQGIESVPWLSTVANAPGEAWNWVTDKTSQGLTDFGRLVNDANIPVVSDFVGSFTGVSEGNGSWASIYGAYGRGIWVKGVGGTIDGLMTIVTNPLESAQGVTHLVANAEEMVPKIADQVGDYVDKNLINGTAESRAEFAGQVVFEVATAVATCGGGTAAKAGVKGADTAVDAARMADKAVDAVRAVDKVSDAARAADKAGDAAKAADKASDAARTADKAGDAAKAADKASDVAKTADKAGDTAKVGESGVKIKGPVAEVEVKSAATGKTATELMDADIAKYKYNMIENPGPLAEMSGRPVANFYGGRYNAQVLTEDKIFYRAGEHGKPLGQWFTEKPPESVAKVRIDTAVKPQWIDPKTGVQTGTSIIDSQYAIKIPKGTTIYTGPVGPQGGVYVGGYDMMQTYIPEPWNIKGVEVISSAPLK